MSRVCVLAMFCAALLAAPAAASAAPPAANSAKAAIVVDASDGAVMFQKNPDQRREIASTTKLMTALLTLERLRPGQVLTAAPYRPQPAESIIGLRPGERMRVHDLLRALLLESANDAAETLAEGIAGSRPRFVALMNTRASQLGLAGTSYANPVGLDDPGNYSTARDLAALAVRLMHTPRFAGIVDLPRAVLRSGAHSRVVLNRNDLVRRYQFVDGVKTGHTIDAGYVLVGAARGAGASVVTVVLGEPSEAARDQDTLTLLRWGLGRFKRVRVLRPDQVLARPVIRYRDEHAALVPPSGVDITVRAGERVSRRVDAPHQLEGPLDAGKNVGSVTLLVDGRPVRRVDLETAAKVPGAGPLRVLLSALGVPLTLLLVLCVLGAGIYVLRRQRVKHHTVPE